MSGPRAQALDFAAARWRARGRRRARRRGGAAPSGNRCRRSRARCRAAEGAPSVPSVSSPRAMPESERLPSSTACGERVAVGGLLAREAEPHQARRCRARRRAPASCRRALARTRRKSVRAAAIETCCSSTMCTSVGNPGRRAHIGGRPFFARRGRRNPGRGARVRATPAASVASVSARGERGRRRPAASTSGRGFSRSLKW